MDNSELQKIYNKIYQNDENTFFSKYINGENVSETDNTILSVTDWKNKTVVDLGCGSGRTAYLIACAGAKEVIGIDYSEAAIKKAQSLYNRDNLQYLCMNLSDWEKQVDIIISNGTIEHLNNPKDAILHMGSLINPDGEVIITTPCFLNIWGIIWMTLQQLLDVPMSLTNLSFISPFDIEEWLNGHPLFLERKLSIDYSKGNGDLMIKDLQKRLTNALKDANLDNTKVSSFLEWMDKVVKYFEANNMNAFEGATMLYIIKKK